MPSEFEFTRWCAGDRSWAVIQDAVREVSLWRRDDLHFESGIEIQGIIRVGLKVSAALFKFIPQFVVMSEFAGVVASGRAGEHIGGVDQPGDRKMVRQQSRPPK
jgi:hypothetical protein